MRRVSKLVQRMSATWKARKRRFGSPWLEPTKATKDHEHIFISRSGTCFWFQLLNGRSFQRPEKLGFPHLVHVVTISVLQGCQKVSKSPHEARHLDLIRELSAKNREKEERVLDA